MSNINMEQLPIEIIENIAKHPKLTIEDVVNFSSSCRYLRFIIIGNNAVWKQKYRDRWPQLQDVLDNNFENYYDEVLYIYELRKRTMELLEAMPAKFYKKYEISDSDLGEWYTLLQERPQVYNYLVTHLMEIVNISVPIINSIEVIPLCIPGNKTLQYYANKVLRYIRQIHLSSVWKSFIALPQEDQILEKGAVLVAQWCQPNIEVNWNNIGARLDDLANQVKQHLSTVNPSHSLFKASPEDLGQWRIKTLKKNQWNAVECRQIIYALKDVFYGLLGFSGNNVTYYMPQNSFINEVLDRRQGLPITLAIIYEGVARRLGLRCDPINSPAHFLLRFTESQDSDSDWYYIDVFNQLNIVRDSACPRSGIRYACPKKEPYPPATAAQVVERMAHNLEVSTTQHTHPNGRITRLRSALELLKLVNPRDISALVSLARLYMLHNMDTRPLEAFLLAQQFEAPEQAQRVVHMLQDYDAHHQRQQQDLFRVEAAQRTPKLKFAVGMVMTHLALNYHCVIYDWDPVCLASADWQRQMNVAKLTLADQQPFYNVLAEDGSHRYVAQENLQPSQDSLAALKLSLSEDLGRHFSHFFYTHFVPNIEKEKEYPADRKIRHQFYHQHNVDTINMESDNLA